MWSELTQQAARDLVDTLGVPATVTIGGPGGIARSLDKAVFNAAYTRLDIVDGMGVESKEPMLTVFGTDVSETGSAQLLTDADLLAQIVSQPPNVSPWEVVAGAELTFTVTTVVPGGRNVTVEDPSNSVAFDQLWVDRVTALPSEELTFSFDVSGSTYGPDTVFAGLEFFDAGDASLGASYQGNVAQSETVSLTATVPENTSYVRPRIDFTNANLDDTDTMLLNGFSLTKSAYSPRHGDLVTVNGTNYLVKEVIPDDQGNLIKMALRLSN